jgi:TfoX/Sxy family transcriptional regulator of competence genes
LVTKTSPVAFDPNLVERVRDRLAGTRGLTELKMFGGWGVTLHGNMAVGVMEHDLIVRVGPDAYQAALERPGARPFDFTGRSMTGWVYVDGSAIRTGPALTRWVDEGLALATSLPPKKPVKRGRPRADGRPHEGNL